MKKILSGLLASSLLFAVAHAYAIEPQNIAVTKKALIQYHDSGEYDKDINVVMNNAMDYLKQRVANRKPNQKLAIILDIDETSLSNYNDLKDMDFGGTIEQIQLAEDKGTDPVIEPTLKLFKFAKANDVAVIFITGRHESEREITSQNLKAAGYDVWDKLILRDGEFTKSLASVYKIAMRKKLEKEGYKIIINIGDQNSDLVGGYSEKTFKLPNPYYFIL